MLELSDVLLEKDSSNKIEDCTIADVVPLPGTSSHEPKNRQDRGRTLYREPRHGSRDSRTPERDISSDSKSTVSSRKKRFQETLQRSRSLLAEGRIPGHVSTTTRKRLGTSTTLKGNPGSSKDSTYRQQQDSHQRDHDHR